MSSIPQTLLGAILDAEGLGSSAAALLDASGLAAQDFEGEPKVRAAWAICARLAEHRRELINANVVFAAGFSARAFAEGDLLWLNGLQSANAIDRAQFSRLSDDWRERLRGERLVELLKTQTAALTAGKTQPLKVIAHLEDALRDLGATAKGDGTAYDDLLEVNAEWEARERGDSAPLYVPTGFPALDNEIGGLPPNLVLIAGEPSVGKTAFLASMLLRMSERLVESDPAGTLGLFGLEDGTRWLYKRGFAHLSGLQLREVGVQRRAEETKVLHKQINESLSKQLSRVIAYRYDSISTEELCRRAAGWIVNHSARAIFVDNASEVSHAENRDDFRVRVGESIRRWRNLAVRYQVPVVFVVHTTRPGLQGGIERPPLPSEISESASFERKARLILGCWARARHPHELRVTITKSTETKKNVTLAFKRHHRPALIDHLNGESIDLEAEKRAEAAERKAIAASNRSTKASPYE